MFQSASHWLVYLYELVLLKPPGTLTGDTRISPQGADLAVMVP